MADRAGGYRRSLGHRPQLDGLRGLAWAGVFIGHAGLAPVPGIARIAMYLFFGLSGFLITAVILEEHHRRGAICLRRFFARRALRLLPALVVFLVGWLAVVAIFGGEAWMTTVPGTGPGGAQSLVGAIEGAAAALFYASNWLDIFRGFTGYLPLGHLWSLAVEEQVYVVWAPLLVVCWRFRRRAALPLAVLLACASTAEAIWLGLSGRGNWSYMGTDARAGAFLLGAAFALAWSRGAFAVLQRQLVGAVVSGGSLLALFICSVPLATENSPRSYVVAWTVATIAGPLLVVSAVERGSGFIVTALSHPVMRYLGRRSYALYLWHYVFLTWFRDLGRPGVGVALIASLAAAELSWRLVESRALSLKERLFVGTNADRVISAQRAAPPTRARPAAGALAS